MKSTEDSGPGRDAISIDAGNPDQYIANTAKGIPAMSTTFVR